MLIYFKKRKKGVPIKKAKYNDDVNINLNRARENRYARYQRRTNVKLFTNDIKAALFTAPTAFVIANTIAPNDFSSNCLYILSGCTLMYASINLYSHAKEKQKKFTLK